MKKYKIIIIILVGLIINMICPFIDVVNAAPSYDSTIRGTKDSGSYKITNQGRLTVYFSPLDSLQLSSWTWIYFKAYKVLDSYYNPTTQTITYQFTTNFKNFLTVKGKSLTEAEYMALEVGTSTRKVISNSGVEVSDTSINPIKNSGRFSTLMKEYAAYIRQNSSINGVEFSSSYYHGYASTSLEVGSYLVLPAQNSYSNNYVFGVMANSIEIDSKGLISNAVIYAKVFKPSVSLLANNQATISVSKDEKFKLKATATVPTYPSDATNKTYKIYIVNGGTIYKNAFKYDSTSSTEVCVKTISGGQHCGSSRSPSSPDSFQIWDGINFYSTNNGYSAYFEVDVSKIVDDSIEVEIPFKSYGTGFNAGRLVGHLEYSQPYGGEMIKSKEIPISISDHGLIINGTPGAVFKVKKGNNEVGEVTIRYDGSGSLYAIGAGDYTIEQTKAPAGYTLLTNTTPVKIGPGGPVDDSYGYTGYWYRVTINNTTPAILPFTGSFGNILFIVFGVIFIIVSVTFFIIYRKKKINNQVLS